MKKCILALAILSLLATDKAYPITVAQARAVADARLEAIWPTVHDIMTACLLSSDGCYTTWSTASLCNTVTADGAVCQMAQTDPGLPDNCGLATGTQTFAGYGIVLPAQDIFAFKLNSYSGPLGRGAQLCVRIRFNAVVYERCRGNGPEADAFTHAWAIVTE